MKVVHILNELRHSGAEVLLSSAASIFLKEGPAAIISTGAVEGNYAPVLRDSGFSVIHIPFAKSPRFLSAIRETFRRGQYDMVHIHPERAASWYSAIAAIERVPSIRTVHNEFTFDGLLHMRRVASRRLATVLGTVHVACSPSVQRNEMTQFGLKTRMINNWMDPQRIPSATPEHRALCRSKLGVDCTTFLAISVANETPAKNLAAIFEGVVAVAKRGLKIRLFHCGEVGEHLRQQAESSGGLITLAGTVSNVGDYLTAGDAFVSASFNEGGQLVLLEAAAAGTFCITTKVGLAELLQDFPGVDYIAPTANEVTTALLRAASLPQIAREKAANALAERVRAAYVPDVGGSQYVKIYHELVNTSNSNT